MSLLREYVRENHNIAESTKFMRALFQGKLSSDLWLDFQYQKLLFYPIIENFALLGGYLKDIMPIRRASLLHAELQNKDYEYRRSTIEYYLYLREIPIGDRRILAHLYVWHMGDMYGGQMIKRMLNFDCPSLTFDRRDALISALEQKLDIDLVDEANISFKWAHRILESYDDNL